MHKEQIFLSTPPSKWYIVEPWAICLSASLFFLFMFLQMNLLNSISIEVMNEFSLSTLQLGKLSASYFLGLAIFFIPAGIIIDHSSIRRLVLICLAIACIIIIIIAITDMFYLFLLMRFTLGCVHAVAFLSCIRLASSWLPKHLGLATGIIITVGISGGILAQMPMAILTSHLGWRGALGLTVVLGAVIWLILWAFVKDNPSREKPATMNTLFSCEIFEIFKNKQNWLCALYTSLLNTPIIILGALWGNTFLMNHSSLSKLQAELVISMIYIGTIIGSPTIGYLSDKFKRRKMIMLIGSIFAILIVMPISMQVSFSINYLSIIFFFTGFTSSVQSLSYPTITESNKREHVGTALGLASSFIMGSAIVFQPLFGWLIAKDWKKIIPDSLLDSYQATFLLVIPTGFLLALICSLLIKETYCVDKKYS